MGYRQMVRHRILVPVCVGSSPTTLVTRYEVFLCFSPLPGERMCVFLMTYASFHLHSGKLSRTVTRFVEVCLSIYPTILKRGNHPMAFGMCHIRNRRKHIILPTYNCMLGRYSRWATDGNVRWRFDSAVPIPVWDLFS